VELAGRGPEIRLPSYLERSPDFAGRVVADPRREDVPFEVKESAVVEFYAR
jgi:ribosomal protein S4